MELQTLSATETYPLRHKILRPHQALSEMTYPGDEDPQNFHVGIKKEGVVFGIASVFMEDSSMFREKPCYRLRGMAVDSHLKGQGWGGKIFTFAMEEAQSRGCKVLWCNARTPAVPFYQRFGLKTYGEEFQMPGIGPHFVMARYFEGE